MVIEDYDIEPYNNSAFVISDDYKIDYKLKSSFLTFMSTIINSVEVSISDPYGHEITRTNQIVYFLRLPHTFYLESQSKLEFINKMDLDNSRQEICANIDILIEEMDLNYSLTLSYPFMYNMTTNDVMETHKIIAWFLGLFINIACLVLLKLNDEDEPDLGARKLKAKGIIYINISSFVFSGYAFLMLMAWLIFKAPIQ